MFNWLKNLFHICNHEYEVIDTYRLFNSKKPDITIAIQYISRCRKCGKITDEIV